MKIALVRHLVGHLVGFTQQAQHQQHRLFQRRQRVKPSFELLATLKLAALQPTVQHRQLKGAGTAGAGGALANGLQPFALAQVLSNLADLRVQIMNHRVHVAQEFGECLTRDLRIVELGAPHTALPIQLLQQISLQITAPGRVDDVKQAEQGAAMINAIFARREDAGASKQLFKSQPGTCPLGQRTFEGECAQCTRSVHATVASRAQALDAA